jgi:hypothetical protein
MLLAHRWLLNDLSTNGMQLSTSRSSLTKPLFSIGSLASALTWAISSEWPAGGRAV